MVITKNQVSFPINPNHAVDTSVGFDNGISVLYLSDGQCFIRGDAVNVKVGYVDFDLDARSVFENPIVGLVTPWLAWASATSYQSMRIPCLNKFQFHGERIALSSSQIHKTNQFRFDFVLHRGIFDVCNIHRFSTAEQTASLIVNIVFSVIAPIRAAVKMTTYLGTTVTFSLQTKLLVSNQSDVCLSTRF